MAIDEQLIRIHERLDDFADAMGDMRTTLAGMAANCRLCLPVVTGNGRGPISERVTLVETAMAESRARMGRVFAVALAIMGVSGTLLGALIQIIGRVLFPPG